MSMRKVIIESPYQGLNDAERHRNIRYARAAIRDSVLKGEAPIASHLLFTQPGILKDWVVEERIKGMQAGWNWFSSADAVIAYVDFGTSNGMADGIALATRMRVPIEMRRIPDWEDSLSIIGGNHVW